MLPPEVSGYWLAPGWLLLALLVTALLVSVAYLGYRQRQRTAFRRQAKTELTTWLQQQPVNSPITAEQLLFLNSLLKRVAMRTGRAGVAALSGSRWHQFLDASANKTLSQESLALLAGGHYQASVDTQLSLATLTRECQRWVGKHHIDQRTQLHEGDNYALL